MLLIDKSGLALVQATTGRVLCDRKFPSRLKGKLYRVVIKVAFLHGTKCWPINNTFEHKMEVTEMYMLRWMCAHTIKDRISNQEFKEKLKVIPVSAMMRKNILKWFVHV